MNTNTGTVTPQSKTKMLVINGLFIALTLVATILVGIMGFVAGTISEKLRVRPVVANTIAVVAALVIKVVGYYFAEVILFGNWIAPFGSIPGNVVQVVVAGIIVVPFAGKLKEIALRY